jgi:hypothetical protein
MKRFSMALFVALGFFLLGPIGGAVPCEDELAGFQFVDHGSSDDRRSLDLLVKKNGILVGQISGAVEGETAGHFFQFLDETVRRQGVSHAFFKLFFEKFPQVRRIDDVLIGDNYDTFKEAYRKSGDLKQAVRFTPFFKAVAKFGFTRIVKIVDSPSFGREVYVIFEREDPR